MKKTEGVPKLFALEPLIICGKFVRFVFSEIF